MADRFALAELVQVGAERGGRDGEVLVQETREGGGVRLVGVGAFVGDEELDAVAGGEDEGFADAGLMGEGAGGVGEARRRR